MVYTTLFLFTTAFALSEIPPIGSECSDVGGSYNIADGRGRFVGLKANIVQTGCSATLTVPDPVNVQEELMVMGNTILAVNTPYTGTVDERDIILWSNGYHYWPEHLPEEELPLDCLHPFSLHCYEECGQCAHCAEDHDLPGCDACGECEKCIEYMPCLEAVQHMPECVEPESFQCLRECRECTTCAQFNDCLPLVEGLDPKCTTSESAECLEECGRCIPCGLGEDGADCNGCEVCERCLDYADCAQGIESFPDDKRFCVQSEAIHCFNDCGHCSECEDRMYCLDAFEPEPESLDLPMCDTAAFEALMMSFPPDVLESCHHAMGEDDVPMAECPCVNYMLDVVSITTDLNCYWEDNSEETLLEGIENAVRHCKGPLPPQPPVPGMQKVIEIFDYPCNTHGSVPEEVNQVYRAAGMGANGREIFRGESNGRWWIYWDDNCGGEGQVPSAWFLTPQEPDFGAEFNLGGNTGGCTNTLRVDHFDFHGFPQHIVEREFYCDGEGWDNQFTRNGFEVKADFRLENRNMCDQPAFLAVLETAPPEMQASCRHSMSDKDEPENDCLCLNWLLDEVSLRLDIDCFWKQEDSDTLRDHATEMCRREPMPVEAIEVSNYPCASHGLEADSLNQVYRVEGMSANGKPIFRGEQNNRWWIYWDDDCGGDNSHPSAWYLTPQAPDFTAPSNLGLRTGGCTNTMRIPELQAGQAPTEINSFMCDDGMWNNEFTQKGWQVQVSYHTVVRKTGKCREDGHDFLSYVHSVIPNTHNPLVADLVHRIEREGCDAMRHDHDLKSDWCTFHPRVRESCECVCSEMDIPKPVCHRQRFESWLQRDLGEECRMLFISGMAEEHRPACDCLHSIPREAAEEMFGDHCYFTEWSDRSFFEMWEDCQVVY